MKKFFFAMMFAVLTVASTCAAADVWIEHWQGGGIDIYAADDSIKGDVSQSGDKYFTVSTKFVKRGEVQHVVKWTFSKYQSDMWRYETSAMDGTHTTVVIPSNPLFEFCMNKLRRSYRITDDGGISYYY